MKQSKFNTMTDALLSRIDDMGERIDELEKRYVIYSNSTDYTYSVNSVLSSADEDGPNFKSSVQ